MLMVFFIYSIPVKYIYNIVVTYAVTQLADSQQLAIRQLCSA